MVTLASALIDKTLREPVRRYMNTQTVFDYC